jgi:hypothetical protein
VCGNACVDLSGAILAGVAAELPTSFCLPRGADAFSSYCEQSCGGTRGCPASLNWTSVTLDRTAGQFSATAQGSARVDVHWLLFFSCTATVTGTLSVNAPVQVSPVAGGETLSVTGPVSAQVTSVETSGCSELGANELAALVAEAVNQIEADAAFRVRQILNGRTASCP